MNRTEAQAIHAELVGRNIPMETVNDIMRQLSKPVCIKPKFSLSKMSWEILRKQEENKRRGISHPLYVYKVRGCEVDVGTCDDINFTRTANRSIDTGKRPQCLWMAKVETVMQAYYNS